METSEELLKYLHTHCLYGEGRISYAEVSLCVVAVFISPPDRLVGSEKHRIRITCKVLLCHRFDVNINSRRQQSQRIELTTMSTPTLQEALALFDDSKPLSIVKLSESLSVSEDSETGTNRSSDVSAENAYTDMSPASLREDLIHYEVIQLLSTLHPHSFQPYTNHPPRTYSRSSAFHT